MRLSANLKKVIISVIAVVMAVFLAAACTQGFTNANPWGWFGTNEVHADVESDSGFILPDEVVGSGISLMSVEIPVEEYAENGISPLAASAYTLTATISPSTAAYTAVDWSVEWVTPSSSWVGGRPVSWFMTVTPTADGAMTANVECLQGFSVQIKVVVTSRQDPSFKAECLVDYARRIEAAGISDGSHNLMLAVPGQIPYGAGSYKVESLTESWSLNSSWAFSSTSILGTVDDSFSATYSVEYSETWINALKTNGLAPEKSAGVKYSLSDISDTVTFGKFMGKEVLSASTQVAIALPGTSSIPNAAYQKFVAALSSSVGETIFTIYVDAVGTYSTCSSMSVRCSVSSSAFSVSDVTLSQSAIVF